MLLLSTLCALQKADLWWLLAAVHTQLVRQKQPIHMHKGQNCLLTMLPYLKETNAACNTLASCACAHLQIL